MDYQVSMASQNGLTRVLLGLGLEGKRIDIEDSSS